VEVNSDQIVFEIPDKVLFKPGTAELAAEFIPTMEKVKNLTAGLEDSNVYIDSVLYAVTLPSKNVTTAKNVAEKRVDIISGRVESGLEHETVEVFARPEVAMSPPHGESSQGLIRFRIKQKEFKKDGAKTPKIESLSVFGQPSSELNVYDNFVKQLTDKHFKG